MAVLVVDLQFQATKERNLTETDNAQNALKWILIETFFSFLQTTNVPFLPV